MIVKTQSLIKQDGHSWDFMECTNMETKSGLKAYRNVDIPMKKLSNSLK
jgi:hypothetical protein